MTVKYTSESQALSSVPDTQEGVSALKAQTEGRGNGDEKKIAKVLKFLRAL